MVKRTIICTPGATYIDGSELEASDRYYKMALEDFDDLVEFTPEYAPHSATPSLEMLAGSKADRSLMLRVFAQQPVIRVGEVRAQFVSSSYLCQGT